MSRTTPTFFELLNAHLKAAGHRFDDLKLLPGLRKHYPSLSLISSFTSWTSGRRPVSKAAQLIIIDGLQLPPAWFISQTGPQPDPVKTRKILRTLRSIAVVGDGYSEEQDQGDPAGPPAVPSAKASTKQPNGLRVTGEISGVESIEETLLMLSTLSPIMRKAVVTLFEEAAAAASPETDLRQEAAKIKQVVDVFHGTAATKALGHH